MFTRMDSYFTHFILLCAYLVTSGNSTHQVDKFITVWGHPHYSGIPENLCVSHCSNIQNPENIRQVSSFNLQGNCARFYDELNCLGKSIEVLPQSAAHDQFVNWNMNHRMRSVGPCRNECTIDVVGNNNEEHFKVQLFNMSNYQGNDGIVIETGCISVPNGFINNVKSIKTFGQCIQLYNNPFCLIANLTSIELRQDTHFHGDLAKWNFPKIESISHCRYKCDKLTNHVKTKEVTIFDQANYAGSWIKIQIDKCINLPYHWEMGTKSLEISDGTCAEIYENMDCNGDSFRIKYNRANLLIWRGILPTRSISVCRVFQPSSGTNVIGFVLAAIFVTCGLGVGIAFLYVRKRYKWIKRDNIPAFKELVVGYNVDEFTTV